MRTARVVLAAGCLLNAFILKKIPGIACLYRAYAKMNTIVAKEFVLESGIFVDIKTRFLCCDNRR
jgi:hypothetical protein